MQAILYELNRPYRGMDEGELRLSLVDYITLSDDCGRGVVLLVDEAHHLPLRLLDEIRSLTNLTRDMQPAVRMVLAGSHVLGRAVCQPQAGVVQPADFGPLLPGGLSAERNAGLHPEPHFGLRRPGRRDLSGRDLPDGP